MSRNPAAAKRRKLSSKKKKKGPKLPTFDWDSHLEKKHKELLHMTRELIDTHNKSFEGQFLSTPTRRTHTMPIIDFSQAEARAFRAVKDTAKEKSIPKSLWDLADKYIPDEPEEVVEVEEAVDESSFDKFKPGTKVYLKDRYTKFYPERSNPVKGSEYECEGTIRHHDPNSGACSVDWDNGTSNTYNSHEDLVPVYELKNCKSIW